MMNFLSIFSALNRKKVRYLVVGGVAVNLYGIERATADIDLVVDLQDNNLGRFIETMKEMGFKPKIPVRLEDFVNKEIRGQWIKEKNITVFSLFDPKNPFFLLDVFVEMPFDFKNVYQIREKMRAGKIVIPVAPMKTLIKMKEHSNRPQDAADIVYLKKIAKE